MFAAIEREEELRRKYTKRRRTVSAFTLYVRILCGTVAVLIFLRLIVLTTEAYAMVASARSSNEDLLRLCGEGIATSSPHMRAACMQARVEHASPAFVRALTSATYSFGGEVYNIALAPLHAISLAGLLSIISALPWLGTLRNAFGWGGLSAASQGFRSNHSTTTSPMQIPEHAVYVLHNGERSLGPSVGGFVQRKRPALLMDMDDEC